MEPETPLSDSIAALLGEHTRADVLRMHAVLLNSVAGIDVQGLPQVQPGKLVRIDVDHRHHFTINLVWTPAGQAVIRVFADPHVFRVRFPETPFSAYLNGREALDMVLNGEDSVAGLLICSATSYNSYAIPRTAIAAILNPPQITETTSSPKRPWWKPW